MKSKKQVKEMLKLIEISIVLITARLEKEINTVNYIDLFSKRRELTAQKKILEEVLK